MRWNLIVERLAILIVVRHGLANHGLHRSKANHAERKILCARQPAMLARVGAEGAQQLHVTLHGGVEERIERVDGRPHLTLAVEIHGDVP